jgi:regulatory protein
MDKQIALTKLRQMCSRQEKCPADVLSLLKRWEVDEDQHDTIVEILKKEKFVDEQRYALAFIRDKIKFEHWGIIKIKMTLQQKGISKNITDDLLKQVDRNEYKEMIGRELAKKRKSLKGTPYEIWAKLARYGSSRGYELEYMQEFLKEHDNSSC